MKHLLADFKTIRERFAEKNEHEPFSVAMEELASLLFCTPRNVKLILAKMINQDWLAFSPGRGRGNKSTIVFKTTVDNAVLAEASKLVDNGFITEAVHLAAFLGSQFARKKLLEQLEGYFGYQRSESNQSYIDLIRIPMFRTFNTLTPHLAFFDFDAHLIRQVYDTLVFYDSSSSQVSGRLAHAWEANAEKTIWTFYLRKGILFHNGKELDAIDVQYTFKHFQEAEGGQKWLAVNIKEIEVIDPYCIRIFLHKRNTMFLQYLSFPCLSIVPNGANDNDYIGTGPFKVESYHKDQCKLSANRSYFVGRPFLDAVEIIHLPKDLEKNVWKDPHNIIVNTGEGPYHPNPEEWEQIENFYPGSSLLTFNLTKKDRPQNHPFFRQAIDLLIDRKKMIEELGPPRIYPSYSFEWKGELFQRSVKDVHTLLKEAGYTGEAMNLYTYERHQPDAEWLQKECRSYGINLEVCILDWDGILHPDAIAAADCILFEAVWGENELSKIELYQSGYSFLRGHLPVEAALHVDETIQEINNLDSPSGREALFAKLEKMLIDHHYVVFLVHKNIESAFSPYIQGARFNARGNIDFKSIWIKPAGL